MLIRRMVPVVLLAVFALAAPVRAQENLKIAIVNTARIFSEMQETKDLKQKIENDRKSLEATDQQKQQDLNAKKQARDLLKPDSPEFQSRNQEYLKAAIDYRAWKEMMQMELDRTQKEQMKGLFEKIESAVGEIAAQRGLDLVLAEQHPEFPPTLDAITSDQLRSIIAGRNILFASPKADISADVITLLDAKYKSRG
ncbi:MAG: OmpH family outer membrane protein [Phycisphaerales bacterium]|jgi:Skp family chaperone for outer membrane proteins|nr:OmpH family outer membrane protein [Phycisphaerales bacterium]